MTLANLLGVPYQVAPHLEDGKVLRLGQDGPIVIGTHKLSEHREEARRIVREGLADVLAWLGEPVHPATGEQVLASINAAAVPERSPLDRLLRDAIRRSATTTAWSAGPSADPVGDIKAFMTRWRTQAS